jgi:bifunctional DNA-binding transcriptional regulator/antitoxin component of YhaV-PrlF toxin-antitoxin module
MASKSKINRPIAARVRSRKQLTLPGEIYEGFGLSEGSFVTFTRTKGKITVPPGTVILSPLTKLAPSWSAEEWEAEEDAVEKEIKEGKLSRRYKGAKATIAALKRK